MTSCSRKRLPNIPASSYKLDESRVRASELASGNSKGKANITKIRPWSALSKDSSASCPHHQPSPPLHRPKTAAAPTDRKSSPSPAPPSHPPVPAASDSQRPARPQPLLIKPQSRLRNGNPVVAEGTHGVPTPLKDISRMNRRGSKTGSETPSHSAINRHKACTSASAAEQDRAKPKSPSSKLLPSSARKKSSGNTFAQTEISESLYNSTPGTQYEEDEEAGTATAGFSRSSTPSSVVSQLSKASKASQRTTDDDVEARPRSLKKISPQEPPRWTPRDTETEPDSEEFDTDLEDDFPPDDELPYDNTGKYVYEAKCRSQGTVPVSFLVRNLGEGNLRMRHHYLGGSGTKPLADALKVNTVCEEIDLSDNYIEGSGAKAIAGVLKDNMFIVNLNISNNFIRAQGADAFCEALEANTTLKTLSLKGNQMSDSDAEKIGLALRNNMSLNCLDLSYNSFGEIGGQHLGGGLAANIGLADLDLSWNCLTGKGGVAICKALAKNNVLEILDLSWNGISNSGATALGATLKVNDHIKVLDISNNRIGKEGAVKLAQGLGKNAGLETLLMGMNPIGEEGTDAILKAIAKNPSLKLVGLEATMATVGAGVTGKEISGCQDIAVTKVLQEKIKELTDNRDILIMYSAGSPQQSRINQTILAVFDRFISENADRMEDLFNQMDKDKSGDITLEEFKYGLKDFGLRLTSKQLDTLLDELDADKSGTIELDELLAGTNIVEAEKQKVARAEMEELLLKESASAVAAAEAAAAEEKAQRAKEFAKNAIAEEDSYLRD